MISWTTAAVHNLASVSSCGFRDAKPVSSIAIYVEGFHFGSSFVAVSIWDRFTSTGKIFSFHQSFYGLFLDCFKVSVAILPFPKRIDGHGTSTFTQTEEGTV